MQGDARVPVWPGGRRTRGHSGPGPGYDRDQVRRRLGEMQSLVVGIKTSTHLEILQTTPSLTLTPSSFTSFALMDSAAMHRFSEPTSAMPGAMDRG